MSEKPVDLEGDLPPTGVPGAPETETVSQTRVACDGGEGALGHPRVWLQIPEARGWVECGYCDKRFVLEGAPDPAHGAHFDKSVGHSDEA
ncbi:NADH dehydrogenase Fe-S protein 6 [Profundibacterium mesophilum KAUST100406-0324]|uniref:NADH dehydrogenase Fe-S protein 6 n=1 Tax=Profundibacterium mesophilum KAUST100406-0324 TaxID=1037889 RepID=A0A921NW42_9RHOB|nr:NADH dehydrogenase Fe-S protein 6 [Profundibacterium mesophilum KAUST100406-0324]